MKTFRRVLDIILGTTGSTFLFYASYQGISEMVNEGPGWYDPSDYAFTILLILALTTIAYELVRLAFYPFALWRAEKLATAKEAQIIELITVDSEDEAQLAALEDSLLTAISFFTPEQVEAYWKKLGEVE